MAILDQNVHPQISELNEYSKVKITCPVCKVKKELSFPKSVINEARQLTTISLPKGLLCDHHFQAFVDKNFIVRGYQKVDFEFEPKKFGEPKADVKLFNEDDEEFFENQLLKEISSNIILSRKTIEIHTLLLIALKRIQGKENLRTFTTNFGSLSMIKIKTFKSL